MVKIVEKVVQLDNEKKKKKYSIYPFPPFVFFFEPIYAIFCKDSWKNNVIKIDEVHRKTDKSRAVCAGHLFSLQTMVDTERERGKRENTKFLARGKVLKA